MTRQVMRSGPSAEGLGEWPGDRAAPLRVAAGLRFGRPPTPIADGAANVSRLYDDQCCDGLAISRDHLATRAHRHHLAERRRLHYSGSAGIGGGHALVAGITAPLPALSAI